MGEQQKLYRNNKRDFARFIGRHVQTVETKAYATGSHRAEVQQLQNNNTILLNQSVYGRKSRSW